jgi:hypothetical protein
MSTIPKEHTTWEIVPDSVFRWNGREEIIIIIIIIIIYSQSD